MKESLMPYPGQVTKVEGTDRKDAIKALLELGLGLLVLVYAGKSMRESMKRPAI